MDLQKLYKFPLSESYFEYDSEIEPSYEDIETHSPTPDIFEQLRTARKKFLNRFLCTYLNINSLRYKFDSSKDLLTQNIVDLLFIAETKLDDSFVDAQFSVDNYHLWRADRTQNGGGVAAFLRSDIPGERKFNPEFGHIEGINIEVNLNGEKWLFLCAYKPPSLYDEVFENDCTLGLDRISEKY